MTIESTFIPIEMQRIVSLQKLEKADGPFSITATDQERDVLCKRLGVLAIDSFQVSYTAKWRQSLSIDHDVQGHIIADVTQACIMTGQPIMVHVDEIFAFRVAHPDQEAVLEEELDAFEDIEFSDTGDIDLGEIATQYLILALDPYIKAPGVSEEDHGMMVQEKSDNPFSVLSQLKKDDI